MTRERMDYAIKLYEGLGYKRIENYPPYQHMDDAVCYAKDLKPGFGVMVLRVL